jgi:hypothetical protein
MTGFLYIFLLFLLCLQLKIIVAIYDEQAGEFDWLKENIGIIEHSVTGTLKYHDKLFVSTSNSVISSIGKNNGISDWRNVLPKNIIIKDIVVSTKRLFIITKHNNISNVKALSLDKGYILWETSITSNDNDITDILIETSKQGLTILSGNAIHFLDMTTGTMLWKISGNDNEYEGLHPVFSQLVLPMSDTISESEKNQYIATGCFVNKLSKDTCANTFITTINNVKKSASFQLFEALNNVAVRNIRIRITSSPDNKMFYSSDIIYGITHSDLAVNVLVLLNEKVSSLDLMYSQSLEYVENGLAIDFIRDNSTINTNTLKQSILSKSDGNIMPIFSNCQSNSHSGINCQVFSLSVPVHVPGMPADLGQDMQPVLNSLGYCSGKDAASVGGSRHSSFGSVITSYTCIGIESTSKSSIISTLSTTKGITFSSDITTKTTTTLPNTAVNSIQHISNYAIDKGLNYILIVCSNGVTISLASSQSEQPIVWTRDESLSQMKQAIILDSFSTSTMDTTTTVNVDFWTRLKMQKVIITNNINDIKSNIIDFPIILSNTINDIIDNVKTSFIPQKKYSNRTAKLLSLAQDKKIRLNKKLQKLRLYGISMKSKRFGFDKISISLSSNINDENSNKKFIDANFKISLLDLTQGDILWSFQPILEKIHNDENIVLVKLVQLSRYDITFVVSTSIGNTFFWPIDLSSMMSSKIGDDGLTVNKLILPSSKLNLVNQPVVSINSVGKNDLVGISNSDNRRYKMVHLQEKDVNAVKVSLFPSSVIDDTDVADRLVLGEYVHSIDKITGLFQSFLITSYFNTKDSIFRIYSTSTVSSVLFSPQTEQIVSITYPTSNDVIDQKYTVLGDDSLLIKYYNPHTVFIVTATHSTYPKEGIDEQSKQESLQGTLLDTISGKIIYRITHDGGSGPVKAVLVENFIFYSYWNSIAKRTELSSIALYEGMVERFGLNPFKSTSSSPSLQQLSRDSQFSAFNAAPPIGIQKTYLLQRGVSTLQHTKTANGVANKHILIATTNGQVFAFDMRQIHPRRPIQDPTQAEKAEGLQKYSPFILFNPQTAVTLDYSVKGGINKIISTPSKLESTSLVLSFGSLDIQFNRVTPSQGFDLLSDDFNHSLLVAILTALGCGVFMVKKMYKKKSLGQAWV